MAYVVQFDVAEEDVEKAFADRIHVLSLTTAKAESRDRTRRAF